jgi:hypothetical protein
MIWLGIDPGFTGAFVAVSNDGIVHHFDMPVEQVKLGGKTETEIAAGLLRDELLSLQSDYGKIRMAVIERPMIVRGQGSRSTARTFEGNGIVRGVLCCLCIPVERVTPQRWKKFMGLDRDKKASLALARAKWPTVDIFNRVKDHNRAEAALIAEYGRRSSL